MSPGIEFSDNGVRWSEMKSMIRDLECWGRIPHASANVSVYELKRLRVLFYKDETTPQDVEEVRTLHVRYFPDRDDLRNRRACP